MLLKVAKDVIYMRQLQRSNKTCSCFLHIRSSRSQTCLVIASRMFGTFRSIASRWKDSNSGQHVEYGQRQDVFTRIIRYARCHAHLGCARSRRDDLESSDVYINISDAGNLGRLSWQEYQVSSLSLDSQYKLL
ncbi:hypothetical protein Bca4012_082561 [Brassica carinata]